MTTTSAPTEPLSARLRSETLGEHETAETQAFIRDLTSGALSLDAYARYLAQLAYVYQALEERRVHAGDPAFVHDPRLHRSAAIASDLRALGVTDPRSEHPPLPETRAYVDRIRHASTPQFVAHHYTRYLGDLAGGQVIARMVAQHYDATPEQLTFARFDHIDKPVFFRREYRDALDILALKPEEKNALIAEAKQCFAANTALFAALGT